MKEAIITFKNVRMVIKADKLLQQHQIISKVVPVPEHISSECGMCLEANGANWQKIQQLLTEFGIEHTITW